MSSYLILAWILCSLSFLVVDVHIMMTNKKTIHVGNIATTVFGFLFGPIAWILVFWWWLNYHWDDPVLKKEEE